MPESAEEKFKTEPVLVLMPVFNDWKSLEVLLVHLDNAVYDAGMTIEVLLVDDASSISALEANFALGKPRAIEVVNILELKRNLGHQRAIALGLAYIEENIHCSAVVVMDSDGEDDPRDVPRLIEECRAEDHRKIVFARRVKRSEGWSFRLFYVLYKRFYKMLTGQDIRVGNFSIIPYEILKRLVVVSEVWNHYAVGVMKAKVPYADISTHRNNRLAGQSHMNFVSLVMHGLSAISVYGDVVGVRLLLTTCVLVLLSIAGIIAAVVVRLTTTLAVPGWATYVVALLLIVLMQAVILSLFFIFIILSGRNNFSFLPQRDYHHFVLGLRKIWSRI